MKNLSIAILLFFTLNTLEADIKTVKLKDGNKINGEILSLNKGVYHIKTESLGVVKIDEVQIEAIYSNRYNKNTDNLRGQFKSSSNINHKINPNNIKMLQGSSMVNPALLNQMMSNPNYVNIINNPKIIEAVQNGDFDSIMQSEDFKALLNSMSKDDLNMIQQGLR